MKTRTFILLSLLLLTLGAVAFIFIFVKRPTTSIPPTTTNDTPFGTSSDSTTVTPTTTPGDNSNDSSGFDTVSTEVPRLRLVSGSAVGGFGIFDKKIRYIERGTGNAYETTTDSGDVARLSNTTSPRIQEAFFAGMNTVVIRTVGEGDVLKTFIADILPPKVASSGEESAIGSLSGKYIDDNVAFISTSLDGKNLFLLNQNFTGAVGQITNNHAGAAKTIFSSRIGEWLPAFYNNTSVALTNRAAANTPGTLLLLNTGTGATTKLLPNVLGLTTLVNPTGTQVLYSSSNPLRLSVYDIKSASSTVFNIATLPEKCTWSTTDKKTAYCFGPAEAPSGTFPDDWYVGAVSTRDSIWKLNAQTGTSSLVYALSDAAIDAIRPTLDKSEGYLLFMNKTDGSLWSYRLAN